MTKILPLAAFLLSNLALSNSVWAADAPAKTAVLVHGAFADGTSWQKVIPRLEKAGLKVIAVQNPLDSLDNDVTATKRAIKNAEGPVVLVGHSWAGVVITEAGTDPKVKSLVYVAAYAPDKGQSAEDVMSKYPQLESRKEYVKDDDGFLRISDQGIKKYFAADLDPETKAVVAATQGPFHIRCISAKVTTAAWREKPTFMVVATKDQIISPQLEKDQAKAANAKAIEIPSSHVAMLSHPKEVSELIIEATK